VTEQIRTFTEKMEHCLIFSHEMFYVTLVLCLNILRLKAVSEITVRETRTSLRPKSVWHRILDYTNRISVANFQVLDHSQNYRIFDVKTIV